MLKPSDIKPNLHLSQDHLQAIELYVDSHLTRGEYAIPAVRTDWTTAEVDHVLSQYRQLGWTVIQVAYSDNMAVFSPPAK